MTRYEVRTAANQLVWAGDDYEEAIYQRDEFNYEYPMLGARIMSKDDGNGTNTRRRTFSVEYLKSMSQTAMRQIIAEVGDSVVMSWGIRGWGCGECSDARGVMCPCLILKVSGLLHTGLVVVALNEGTDLYEVQLRTDDGQPKGNWHTDIYCDQLGSLIDSLIERPAGMTDEEYKEMTEIDDFAKLLSDVLYI